jgi:uroporphyrin-III C-methyltransferase/precorrin-2 dehydrogenase/sirohydrochlorin ferrochelatase
MPVNVVDRPDLSSFIMPAIVERDPVVIGISTGGAAPLLARRIRATIEALLPARLGRLVRFAESFRGSVQATIPDARARLRFWERFFEGPLAGAVLAGDESTAREQMLSLVNRPQAAPRPAGVVHIVGAGPGDPDLLTLRALRLMQQADVVVYDKLVGPEILDYARRDAERIYVGKSKGNHARTQDQINELLVVHARTGKRVLRLKGGDPFIFGRGGEEREHLRRAGVRVEVVPGITAATGCAAATGIPLTHRDHAAAATFVTGHGRNGEPDLDWAALARIRHTLVIYMGVSTAGRTAARLIEHGMAPDTPVAVVENGTLESQKTAIGTLAHLGALVAEHGIAGPAIIVVGEVVREADAAALTERLHALAV